MLGDAGAAAFVVAVTEGRKACDALVFKVEHASLGRVDVFERQRANRFTHGGYDTHLGGWRQGLGMVKIIGSQ